MWGAQRARGYAPPSAKHSGSEVWGGLKGRVIDRGLGLTAPHPFPLLFQVQTRVILLPPLHAQSGRLTTTSFLLSPAPASGPPGMEQSEMAVGEVRVRTPRINSCHCAHLLLPAPSSQQPPPSTRCLSFPFCLLGVLRVSQGLPACLLDPWHFAVFSTSLEERGRDLLPVALVLILT